MNKAIETRLAHLEAQAPTKVVGVCYEHAAWYHESWKVAGLVHITETGQY